MFVTLHVVDCLPSLCGEQYCHNQQNNVKNRLLCFTFRMADGGKIEIQLLVSFGSAALSGFVYNVKL